MRDSTLSKKIDQLDRDEHTFASRWNDFILNLFGYRLGLSVRHLQEWRCVSSKESGASRTPTSR